MTAPSLPRLKGHTIGGGSLPPWDRDAGTTTNLAPRVGEHVAMMRRNAANRLGTGYGNLGAFFAPGIVREALIVERPYARGKVTHACVTEVQWTRIHLDVGEALVDLTIDDPATWTVDTTERDYEGRTCVRVRPHSDGQTGDLVIVGDQRTYRVRLVSNPTKVTIGLSWTHPGQVRTTPHGRRLAPPGNTTRDNSTKGRHTRFVLFELGCSLQDLFKRWALALRPTKAWQLQLYRRLRYKAGIPPDWPHPQPIVELVLSRLLAIQGLSEAEIRQYLELARDGEQSFVDALREMATGRRLNRLPLPAGVSPTMEDLLDPFPFLAGLPETCYQDEDAHQDPPERARRVVWSMGPAAEHAALFCAVAPRFIRRPDAISRTLTLLALLERMALAAGIDFRLDDASGLRAAIDHVLESPACAHMSMVVRHDIARCARLVVRILRKYIRLHDPRDLRGLHRLLPVDPVELGDLPGRMGAVRREVNEVCRANRKKRVHQQAGRLAALEFAADLNLEQVVLANRALTAAEVALGDRDFIDAPVQMTIVDGRGRLKPGKQLCIWRIWNARAYVARLLRGNDMWHSERARLQGLLDALDAGATMAPVREYRRTEGLLGSVPIEPFHVRCWKFGLMARPGPLPPRILTKRQAVLRELKLPGHMRCATGLMEGTAQEMDLWRLSLWQGRTIAFLDPFEHALRFGHLALSSVSENMSRTTAWMQQVQDQEGWAVRRLNKQPVAGFLALDKLSPYDDLPDEMTWFPVGPKHLAEMGELVTMTCRRCGYEDGMLPEILHLEKLRWKRPEPKAWVFAFDGTPLRTGDLSRFLRFLLPGIGHLTYHDFRHLLANAAFEAGVAGWKIRLCLNHGSTELWLYYAEQSEWQLARVEDRSLRAIATRSADARAMAA
jgi:hypothetical protein